MSAAALPAGAACIVIGGGAVGCSLAYHLARQGLPPLLLERDALGSGSTGRCAGGVRQQFSTEVNVRVGMMSRHMLERFEEELGASAALRQIGYLFLASSPEHLAQFERNVGLQQRCGLDDVRLVSVVEIGELVPELRTDDLVGGTYCPSDGLAGPNEVTLGYAQAARRAGATLVEGMAVDAIECQGGRVVAVRCGDHRIATELVVNCAGPQAAVVAGLAGVSVPVQPFRRHLFITDPLRMQRAPAPMTVDFRTSFYFHPEGEGLLLGMSDPAEPSSFDTTLDWSFLEHLVEHASQRLPLLEHAGIAAGWAGLYEVTPDHQAIVGEHPDLPGLWLCCGFSGHGFMQAPAMGRLLATRLLGGEPEIDLSPFDPRRFARQDLRPEVSVI